MVRKLSKEFKAWLFYFDNSFNSNNSFGNSFGNNFGINN